MARMVWVFDNIGCLFELVPPEDPFDGGEIRETGNVVDVTILCLLTRRPKFQERGSPHFLKGNYGCELNDGRFSKVQIVKCIF